MEAVLEHPSRTGAGWIDLCAPPVRTDPAVPGRRGELLRFLARIEADGRTLPQFVRREFEDYLKCGRLEHGFLRVRCTDCHAEKLVAFSCKRRGFCPSCGARRMVESAALLVDEVLPDAPFASGS